MRTFGTVYAFTDPTPPAAVDNVLVACGRCGQYTPALIAAKIKIRREGVKAKSVMVYVPSGPHASEQTEITIGKDRVEVWCETVEGCVDCQQDYQQVVAASGKGATLHGGHKNKPVLTMADNQPVSTFDNHPATCKWTGQPEDCKFCWKWKV